MSELNKQNAISEETGIVGTQEFFKKLTVLYNLSVSTFNNAAKRLYEKGYIGRRQIGKGEKGVPNSCIWLTQENNLRYSPQNNIKDNKKEDLTAIKAPKQAQE